MLIHSVTDENPVETGRQEAISGPDCESQQRSGAEDDSISRGGGARQKMAAGTFGWAVGPTG